jgi:glycosyltransferase involved in cell wall biosynthesis
MGFTGKSLYSFRRARALGYDALELVAANTHVEYVRRQHQEAARVTGIRDTWLNGAQIRRTCIEYEMADVIYVHSEYVRQSFLEAGIAESKLKRMTLNIADRFQPPTQRVDDGRFRIVYVGRLDATKGIPLLMEAFDRLPVSDKELILVGGWSSAAMRRRLEPQVNADERITLGPGDPLPALHQADVFVHPTFEDGFAYAPAEALACGVPVIVTEETGMKEYVLDGENGFVVPAGSVDALIERLLASYQQPRRRLHSLLPEMAPSTPLS